MRIKPPFQAFREHAGQGWNGRRTYFLERWVLRAYMPTHDKHGVLRVWHCPFIAYLGKAMRVYHA